MATFDTSSIEPLKNEADSAAQQAVTASSSAQTLPDMIKSALTQKYSTDNPLIQQRGTALQNFLTAGTTNKYAPQNQNGVVFSPSQIRSLESADRASAVVPLVNLNDIISAGYGGIGNVVDSASRAFAANANALQGAAGIKRQSYLDALDNLKYQTQLQLENQKLAQSGTGGVDYGSLIAALLGKDNGQIPDQGLSTDQIFNQIKDAAGGNEQGIWNYLNQNQDALRAEGVDVDALWKMHQQYANNGLTLGGLGFAGTPQGVSNPNEVNYSGLGNIDFSGLQGLR